MATFKVALKDQPPEQLQYQSLPRWRREYVT
jgi:hypothetical protein